MPRSGEGAGLTGAVEGRNLSKANACEDGDPPLILWIGAWCGGLGRKDLVVAEPLCWWRDPLAVSSVIQWRAGRKSLTES